MPHEHLLPQVDELSFQLRARVRVERAALLDVAHERLQRVLVVFGHFCDCEIERKEKRIVSRGALV